MGDGGHSSGHPTASLWDVLATHPKMAHRFNAVPRQFRTTSLSARAHIFNNYLVQSTVFKSKSVHSLHIIFFQPADMWLSACEINLSLKISASVFSIALADGNILQTGDFICMPTETLQARLFGAHRRLDVSVDQTLIKGVKGGVKHARWTQSLPSSVIVVIKQKMIENGGWTLLCFLARALVGF